MVTRKSRLTTAILCCAAVLSVRCARAKSGPTQIRALSDQEAADLWNQAESHEPVGKPVVRNIPGAGGTTTVTTQVYMLRMRGGGSNGLVTACGFSCIAPAGTSPHDCKTSGCVPSGNSCTPASCGNCTLSQPCRAEANWGIFGAGAFIADLPRHPEELARLDPGSAARRR